jgi:alkylation response protein AidB-like acyl-CoA dehydrogenase
MVANGPLADVVVFAAVTDAQASPPSLSLFVAGKGTPGMTLSAPLPTMGLSGVAVGEIHFEGCRLPADALLGAEHGGAAILDALHATARIGFAAGCVGVASRILNDCLAYSGTRKVGGKPIFNFQEVSFKLADMRTMIDGGRLLVQYAAFLHDRGDREAVSLAACAKLFAAESLTGIAQAGLSIHGGLGYFKKCAMERLYRDARFFEMGLGTSEVLRGRIARRELERYR